MEDDLLRKLATCRSSPLSDRSRTVWPECSRHPFSDLDALFKVWSLPHVANRRGRVTDERPHVRNAAYLHAHFGTAKSCIPPRIAMGRVALTPEWTIDDFELDEWADRDGG